MTLNITYLSSLKKDMLAYAETRRTVIKDAGDVLHVSKRAIFAIQKGELDDAKKKIDSAAHMLASLEKKYRKDPRVPFEGSYRAALEEYVEACLLYQWVTTKKIGKITGAKIDSESYVAGLADVVGELYRFAIAAAIERDYALVEECAQTARRIVGELIEFDLTKYLRNKFDQAKHASQKIDHIMYELSLTREV